MPPLIFAYVAFAVLAGIFNLYAVARLRRDHDNPELNSWFYFLVGYNLVNFVSWIGSKKILPLLFAGSGAVEMEKVRIAYGLFALPVLLISCFFYLLLFVRLSGHKLPLWLTAALVTTLALLGAAIFWLYLIDFPGGDLTRIQALWRLFNQIGTSYYMLLPLPFLAASFFNRDSFERRRNRAVIFSFMAVMAITYLTPLHWLQPFVAGLKIDLLALLLFLLPLLPLRVERHYLELGLRLRPPPQAALDMKPLCDEFAISAREREILEMVVAGKSRRDIEAALFISASTVKSHLYSAYKKLDVKNRVQLLNMLQHAQRRGEPGGRQPYSRR